MKRSSFKKLSYAEAKLKLSKRVKPYQTPKIKRSKAKRPKLASVSSLEKKVWILCKMLVRKYWCRSDMTAFCFTCNKHLKDFEDMHTGHWRKKSILPMSHKYDLRMLKIQCPGCNLFRNGNEAEYTIRLMKLYGEDWVNNLDREWKTAKLNLKGSAENREFLVNLINDYSTQLAKPLDK